MAENDARILVVDDEMLNRTLLSTNLKETGYTVSTAENGEQALLGLELETFDLVLLDLIMPEVDGFQVLERMKSEKSLRHIPVIVVSGEEDKQSIIRCIEMGAVDYLSKPVDPVLLHARINSALASKRLHDQETSYQKELERRVWEQTKSLQESYERQGKALEGTVLALSSIVELRDPYTAGHQQRVTNLACRIARGIRFSPDQTEGLRIAGLLHDLGKIYVPLDILSRPGRIADIEFNIIKVHPQVGYDVLKNVEFPWPIAQIVVQHHEALDGSGYPNGLSGDAILMEARIIMVADVVEAITNHRPYRPALGMQTALDVLANKRGQIFDPVVADACLEILQQSDTPFE